MAALTEPVYTQLAFPEDRSRRIGLGRRLRLVITLSFVLLALGLMVSDFCRMAFSSDSSRSFLLDSQPPARGLSS